MMTPMLGPTPSRPPYFVGSDIYRDTTYASGHPLAIPRISLAIDLCRAMGWLTDEVYLESPIATITELESFHDPAYLVALREADETGEVSATDRERFHLGINGNPIFPGMFRRPATACGGGLLAVRRLMQAPGAVFSPAGGQHHGRADRASGFCFLSEPALSIGAMLDGGAGRVFYLDLDAHHGDGVQDAFADDERVFTLSIHERGRWPLGRQARPGDPGTIEDRAGGRARNLPVPQGFNDSELAYLMETAVTPLIADFDADAVYLQCGADALADDPQSKLALSNAALWAAVAMVRDVAPRLLITGGGGYNPYAVGRCWAGVWATLNRLPTGGPLPAAAIRLLEAVQWRHRLGRKPKAAWLNSLADPPHIGPVRDEIRTIAETVLAP